MDDYQPRSISTLHLLMIGALIIFYLSACLGPEYLDEPPIEFYELVEQIPKPHGVEIASEIERVISPRETCTTFLFYRLYGSNEGFDVVKAAYLRDLTSWSDTWQVYKDNELALWVLLDDRALVGLAQERSSVAKMWFDEEVVSDTEALYETTLVLSVEDAYGNCVPHPGWDQEE